MANLVTTKKSAGKPAKTNGKALHAKGNGTVKASPAKPGNTRRQWHRAPLRRGPTVAHSTRFDPSR